MSFSIPVVATARSAAAAREYWMTGCRLPASQRTPREERGGARETRNETTPFEEDGELLNTRETGKPRDASGAGKGDVQRRRRDEEKPLEKRKKRGE